MRTPFELCLMFLKGQTFCLLSRNQSDWLIKTMRLNGKGYSDGEPISIGPHRGGMIFLGHGCKNYSASSRLDSIHIGFYLQTKSVTPVDHDAFKKNVLPFIEDKYDVSYNKGLSLYKFYNTPLGDITFHYKADALIIPGQGVQYGSIEWIKKNLLTTRTTPIQ